jgi:hypothetical protein
MRASQRGEWMLGEHLPLRLVRRGQPIELSLALKKVRDPVVGSDFRSDHRDAPPTVITADIRSVNAILVLTG